jgi:MbtH protein
VESPFENDDLAYVILINDENQHSLWPADMTVPAGWNVIYGPDSRTSCLNYVDSHWVDMRPASLVAKLNVS